MVGVGQEGNVSEVVKRAAVTLNEVWQRYGQTGDLRTARLPDALAEALARAVIDAYVAAIRKP